MHFYIKNSKHVFDIIKSNPKGLNTFGPISRTPAMQAMKYSLRISLKNAGFYLKL